MLCLAVHPVCGVGPLRLVFQVLFGDFSDLSSSKEEGGSELVTDGCRSADGMFSSQPFTRQNNTPFIRSLVCLQCKTSTEEKQRFDLPHLRT